MNTITIPTIPAQRISRHNNMPAIIVINGAAHIAFITIETISKRFTSFDNKLTIFPGAVSPNAVCDRRKAYTRIRKLNPFKRNS